MSQQTTKDSTTTLTTRSVLVSIPADTVASTLSLATFTHQFSQAAVGALIAHQRSKTGRASYTIVKKDNGSFELEAVAAGKDTTASIQDSKTVVHTKTTQVVKEEPSRLAKVWVAVKDYTLLLVLVLVLVLVLLKRFM